MTKYSIKKPFTVLVGVALIIVLGVVSFLGLNTDLLPNIELPYVMVVTTYPGASPEKVEISVTKPLEQAVSTTGGLENMQSISQENMSILVLEFSQTINMDSVMLELSNNVDMVSGYFDDMVQSPMLLKLNPDMLPVQVLSVDVEGMDIKALTEYIKTDLSPRLERIDGVATVDISGAVEDHIDILLNQDKIDSINDSILKAVNKDLYKAKKELTDAQKKLTDGKNELKTQQEDAYNKLSSASAELDAGSAQAQAIAAEKTKLEAQKSLLQGAQKMLDGIKALGQSKNMLASLTAAPPLGMGFPPQTNLGTVLLDPNLPLPLKGAIQAMIDGGTANADTTIEGLLSTLDGNIAALQNSLREMGIDEAIITSADKTLLSDKILQTDADIKQATFMAKQMSETLSKLKSSYEALEKAKLSTSSSLAVATVKLDSAQEKLDSGLKEFESARDSALKQANVNSLVTQSMLSNILTAQNFSMPAGYVKDGAEKLTVKVGEKFSDLSQVENLLLLDMGLKGVEPIYLKDVADISIKDNASDNYVKINGNDGILLSLQKSSIASTSKVTSLVNKSLEELMSENPSVHFTTLMDQGVYIGMIINSVMENLLYGGIIAFLVLLVFLRDLRPTLIIGFSIPISLLFSIVLMYFSGVNLNIISLSGLALGVGMLVDNSIVVIENTYRLRHMGYSAVHAAVVGAKQVGGAIFASTLTTVCVFLPIVFTQGLSRQLFTDMGLTIGYSLIASLIVALTVVPAMASTMLTNTKEVKHGFFDKMVEGYTKALRFNLKHKWIVLAFTTCLMGLSIYYALKMPMSFIPPMDSAQMNMTLSLPKETKDEELIAQGEIIAKRVQSLEDVATVGLTMSGSGGAMSMASGSEEKSLSFYVVLDEDKKLSNEEVAKLIKEQNPEFADTLSISTSSMNMSMLGGSGVSIAVKGNDLDQLQKTSTQIANILKGVKGIDTVSDGGESALEEIRIDIDKDKAMKHGLTVAQCYQKVSEALSESTTATTMTFDGKDMSTIIHAPATYDKDTVSKLVMATEEKSGKKDLDILLSDMANIYTAKSPNAINRDNQSRIQTVTATVAEGYNVALVSRDVQDAMADFVPEKGYSYTFSGENETIMAAMKDLFKMIALAIVFIYLIMVAQFQSLMSPFIVLFTIPLAFTGGLLALQFTGTVLSVTSMIGFLVLAGVVVNNGIVFVDYVNQLRGEGMDKTEALVATGKDRIRPILMTALTTILAMSTMAMGVGMGSAMSQGMAIVTIGGLSYATLLTLFLVPALYDILHRREIKNIDVDFEE
ncbi:MAG: efflux RND transporter permease subunit [Oscillospiraceae bacterium]